MPNGQNKAVIAVVFHEPLKSSAKLLKLMPPVLCREKIAIGVEGEGCWHDNGLVGRLWHSEIRAL